jgi:hypothetical protein
LTSPKLSQYSLLRGGNATDEVWKAAQFGGCEFVGVAVELGWEG